MLRSVVLPLEEEAMNLKTYLAEANQKIRALEEEKIKRMWNRDLVHTHVTFLREFEHTPCPLQIFPSSRILVGAENGSHFRIQLKKLIQLETSQNPDCEFPVRGTGFGVSVKYW